MYQKMLQGGAGGGKEMNAEIALWFSSTPYTFTKDYKCIYANSARVSTAVKPVYTKTSGSEATMTQLGTTSGQLGGFYFGIFEIKNVKAGDKIQFNSHGSIIGFN